MIRLITGGFLVLGSVGGMEMGSMGPGIAIMFAVHGLMAIWWALLDGTIHRLAGIKKLW